MTLLVVVRAFLILLILVVTFVNYVSIIFALPIVPVSFPLRAISTLVSVFTIYVVRSLDMM